MLYQHIAYKTFLELQKQLTPFKPKLKLYVLVDGLEYERLFQNDLIKNEVTLPLFIRNSNKDVYFAGPWLVDIMKVDKEMQNSLLQLEQVYPSTTWLISMQSLTNLFNQLESQLYLRLPDKRNALLRFYDPRVLHKLLDVFTPEQLKLLTLNINDWIYYHNHTYYSLIRGKL